MGYSTDVWAAKVRYISAAAHVLDGAMTVRVVFGVVLAGFYVCCLRTNSLFEAHTPQRLKKASDCFSSKRTYGIEILSLPRRELYPDLCSGFCL